MATQTADWAGYATNATFEHYKDLSKSNAGLIFVEYSFVHQSGKAEANQLGADSNKMISGLKKLLTSLTIMAH